MERMIYDRNALTDKYIGQNKYKMVVYLLAVFSAFVGHITIVDYLIATAWMVAALYLFNKEDFWVLFIPLSIFENTIFFYFTDYTIFKILLLLAVLKLLLALQKKLQTPINWYWLVFTVLALYAVFNLWAFLPGIVSIAMAILSIFMMCYSAYRMHEQEFFKRAMFGFVIFAVAAGIYGMLHGNSLVLTQNGDEMLRFCGTSADPNTMGYKFVIGMVALWFTDAFQHKILKYIIGFFLLLMIFRTGSTTAMIALCVFAVLVILLQKNSAKRIVFVIVSSIIVVFTLLNIESILTFFSNNNILSIEGERLLNQYYLFVGGDISGATSLRTEIWAGYMDYFWNKQGIFSQIFGGNVSNIYAIEKNFADMSWDAAAHNTNIDILMSIGIFGLFIIYYYSLKKLMADLRLYKKTTQPLLAMKISIKFLTIFYTFSLSSFLSYGFMIFLL